jgi:hypothetical protein
MSERGPIKPKRLSGAERFTLRDAPAGFDVLSYWQWVGSNLIDNTARGLLAEFIVARALSAADGVRVEWDEVDVLTASKIRVEVKSAAYIQSWHQEKPSIISFNIPPTQGWDPEPGKYTEEQHRQADVYVFSLLAHLDQETVNPLELDQWEFMVLSARTLDDRLGTQKTIRLGPLKKLGPECVNYESLAKARIGTNSHDPRAVLHSVGYRRF